MPLEIFSQFRTPLEPLYNFAEESFSLGAILRETKLRTPRRMHAPRPKRGGSRIGVISYNFPKDSTHLEATVVEINGHT